ncbi:hypothetical protein [Acidovorax sp. SRB_14]|nr:hypothetical protein [Acidovorax sp. SRB_14]
MRFGTALTISVDNFVDIVADLSGVGAAKRFGRASMGKEKLGKTIKNQ